MATPCGICGAACDGAYICTGDTRNLATDLLRVPGALAQLRITHAGGDVRTGPGGGRNPGGPAPLPWNEAAARLIRDLDRHVRSSSRLDNRDIPPEAIAVRRARAVHLIRRHPDAPAYAKELHRLLDRSQRVIDRRATLWDYGPCHCGQQLHGEPDASTVVCGACNTSHDAVALKERQWQAAAGSLVTRSEAAQWLAIRHDVDPLRVDRLRRRIDLWIHRARVVERPGGLLRFGDVDQQYRKGQEMVAAKAARNRQAANLTTTRSA